MEGNITSQSLMCSFDKEKKKDIRKIKEEVTKCNIQMELRAPLLFAQFLSLLPIYGTSHPDFKNLKIKWRSFKTVYSMAVTFLSFILCIFALIRYERERGISYASLGDIIFYGSILFTSIFFLKLVNNWKDIVSRWAAVQKEINNFDSLVVEKKNRIITICLIFSSVFEHILSNTQSLLIAEDNIDRIRSFFNNENVFYITGYTTWFAAVLYLINFLVTLIWNYPDIFLTAVSLSLANMYKQFNKDLEVTSANVTKEVSLIYWRKKREVYNKISRLTEMVENKVSQLVLVSFAVNIYFICIQLLNSIQPLRSLLQVVYFCGSFGHILLRSCAVCYAASSIYDHSKKPLSILFSVPSEQYNFEVQRFVTQISAETLALTGCKYFTVTRRLMLTIAGTIVTYEVVLVQFNGLTTETVSQ